MQLGVHITNSVICSYILILNVFFYSLPNSACQNQVSNFFGGTFLGGTPNRLVFNDCATDNSVVYPCQKVLETLSQTCTVHIEQYHRVDIHRVYNIDAEDFVAAIYSAYIYYYFIGCQCNKVFTMDTYIRKVSICIRLLLHVKYACIYSYPETARHTSCKVYIINIHTS